MPSQKQLIFDWFYRTEFGPETLDFTDLLISAAENALGKSRIEAEAFAVANRNQYWNWLLEQLDLDRKRGLKPLFVVVRSPTPCVGWHVSYFDDGRLTAKERHKLHQTRVRASVLRKIDLLTDRQYEALGCVTSRLLGADKVLLTPRGNEGGIDFFATITLPATSHIFSGQIRPLRVIGQCKKYTEKVNVNRLKEFMTTLDWVKNRNPIVEGHVPIWFRLASGPIIGWIIAHSGFQSGAELVARDQGVVLSDSLDLAEIVALSRRLNGYSLPKHCAELLYDSISGVLREFP